MRECKGRLRGFAQLIVFACQMATLKSDDNSAADDDATIPKVRAFVQNQQITKKSLQAERGLAFL